MNIKETVSIIYRRSYFNDTNDTNLLTLGKSEKDSSHLNNLIEKKHTQLTETN